MQYYDFSSYAWKGLSLEALTYFPSGGGSPNTVNTGGPMAIDPLDSTINFITDKWKNLTAAIFKFGATPNFVALPSNINSAISWSYMWGSAFKPVSHVCYYMTAGFLSFSPPAWTGFF